MASAIVGNTGQRGDYPRYLSHREIGSAVTVGRKLVELMSRDLLSHATPSHRTRIFIVWSSEFYQSTPLQGLGLVHLTYSCCIARYVD